MGRTAYDRGRAPWHPRRTFPLRNQEAPLITALLCIGLLASAGSALGARSALGKARERRYRMSDEVAQGLVTVRYALEAGEHELAVSAAEQAHASSRLLAAAFLPRVLRPGALRRAADA